MRLVRSLCAAAAVVVATIQPAPIAAGACWSPPTDAPVVDPFREPACRWCPGNRGIEYGTRVGDAVRAVAGGHVSFAGSVAGVTYVVVEHADGRRATYGRLATSRFRTGDTVIRGVVVGRASGRVHFGLRRGDTYVDPAPYIGHLVHRPRLVPIDGRAANPAPPPVLRCGRAPGVPAQAASGGESEVGGMKRNGWR